MLSQQGETGFQKERFDYDFTHIFRSNQDIDIVIDGGPEEVTKFQAWISVRFPIFQGNKEKWEVRSLNHAMGNKQALLGDFNFRHQHTDSQSTGMIEITDSGGPRVRDLLQWDDPEPAFLKDAASGKITYHFSSRHQDTERAIQGINPPIFSVIRYLTKAFQFGLKIQDRDRSVIQQIIWDFQPHTVQNAYVLKWLQNNTMKLIFHSLDLVRAKDTMDELGLTPKLLALPHCEAIAPWLTKEPLRDSGDLYIDGPAGPICRKNGKVPARGSYKCESVNRQPCQIWSLNLLSISISLVIEFNFRQPRRRLFGTCDV